MAETFRYCNLHPDGKRVGDCVKRAISGATGKDYNEVKIELNRTKKITGCSKFNDDKNWKYYVEHNLNGTKLSFPVVKGIERMNGQRFAETHPTGCYILRMAHHLTCCRDGIIYDTWDCRDKCVYFAYKVEPVGRIRFSL